MNVMQQPALDLPYGTVPGTPRSDIETFFGFHLYSAEDIAKISKVPGAPRNVNPARVITWLVGVIIYCTIFQ